MIAFVIVLKIKIKTEMDNEERKILLQKYISSYFSLTNETHSELLKSHEKILEDHDNLISFVDLIQSYSDNNIKRFILLIIDKMIDKLVSSLSNNESDKSILEYYLHCLLRLFDVDIGENFDYFSRTVAEFITVCDNEGKIHILNKIREQAEVNRTNFLTIFNQIIDSISVESLGNILETCLQVLKSYINKPFTLQEGIIFSLTVNNIHSKIRDIQIHECDLFVISVANKVMEILNNGSANIYKNDICSYWSLIQLFLCHDVLDDEQIIGLLNIMLSISQDQNIDTSIRYNALSSLTPVILKFGEDDVVGVLQIALKVCAEHLENEQIVETDPLKPFEELVESNSVETTYKILEKIIIEYINQDDTWLSVSAVLLISVVASKCTFYFNKNAELYIKKYVVPALQTGNQFLVEAALVVIQSLEDNYSVINEFAKLLFEPLIYLSGNIYSEIKEKSLMCLLSILEEFSGECELLVKYSIELFKAYEGLGEETYKYFDTLMNIISNSIIRSGAVDDEDLESVIDTVQTYMDDNSILTRSRVFCVYAAIIEVDIDQADSILSDINKHLESAFQSDDPEVIMNASRFISDVCKPLAGKCEEFFRYYIQTLKDLSKFEYGNLASYPILALSLIFKYYESLRSSICNESFNIFKKITEFLKNEDETNVFEAAVKSIKILSKFTPVEMQEETFMKLVTSMETLEDISIIYESFYVLSKMLNRYQKSSVLFEKAAEIALSIINGTHPILKGEEFVSSLHFSRLAEAVFEFFSSVLHFPQESSKIIIDYILEVVHSGVEFPRYSVVGCFENAIKNDSVPKETILGILNSFSLLLEDDSADNIQNVSYFFAFLIRLNTEYYEFISNYIPIIDNWYDSNSKECDYKDACSNIGSLYLEMATKIPNINIRFLVKGIEQFPPHDVEEMSSMADLLLHILDTHPPKDVEFLIFLSFARFILLDSNLVASSKITHEKVIRIYQSFREIALNDPESFNKILGEFGKYKYKVDKLTAVYSGAY